MEQKTVIKAFYGARWLSAGVAALLFLRCGCVYGILATYLLLILGLHWTLAHFFLSAIDEEDVDEEAESEVSHMGRFLSHLQRGRIFLLVTISATAFLFKACSFKSWVVVFIYLLGICGLRLYRYLNHVPIPAVWPHWPRRYLSILCEWIKEATESPY